MRNDQHSQQDPQRQYATPQEQTSDQIPHPGRTGEMTTARIMGRTATGAAAGWRASGP
jgi:hypothetical protein